MKPHSSFLLIILAGLSFNAMAQGQTLSIETCRELALSNNATMQKAALSVASAKEQQREAFTNFFPSISASGTYFKADKDLVEIDLSPMGMPTTAGIIDDGTIGTVMATWPIFAGGQILNGNRLADVGYNVSQLQYVQSQNEVLLTAEQYYWQVVKLEQKRETLLSVSEQLASIGQDAQNAVDAGVALNNDLLQVQLKQNEVESGLSTLESGIKVCRMLLTQYCGGSLDSLYDVQTVVKDSLPSPTSLYVDPQTALGNIPEYGLLDQNLKAKVLQYHMEVGKRLPTVALSGGYLYNDLMNTSVNRMIGGVVISVPITDWWGGSHAISRQKNAIRTAQLEQQDAELKLVIRMEAAYSDLENAYRQAIIAHQSIQQSTENLRIAQDQYQAGTSTMSDLLQAQTLYQQSHDSWVDSMTEYQLKRLEYLQTTGR